MRAVIRKNERVAPLANGKRLTALVQIFVVQSLDTRKIRGGKSKSLTGALLYSPRLVAYGSVRHQISVVLRKYATRKTVLLAFARFGRKFNALALPIHQIGAGGIRPTYIAPRTAFGIVLIKQMIYSVTVHRSVRVVHPIFNGCEMINGFIVHTYSFASFGRRFYISLIPCVAIPCI